ncbi:type III-B CRISPR-associated protein Cas10/Cmr2 [Verrucomicrobia bacterium S94]|nr:type III-B CRISPR-associated protein Cas10/Cmr2 [Verrucomicrobia bacterium S94]
MSEDYWKKKLMAYLHDPPCKCFDIGAHERIAEGFRNEAGIEPAAYQAFAKICDHTASAADRFPFPSRKCSSKFTGGEDFPFKHPFCNATLKFHVPVETAELAEEQFQKAIGGIPCDLDWKSKFFLYWRRWPEEAAKQDRRLAYLPADTRIPDHTIWNHMGLTSAFQACVNESGDLKPAFLQFQLGPVQEFIAAAKSTRDLAAGSYLLSWLMAHAMKAVADEVGPDAVIFPNLRGQPIFDLLNKSLYDQIRFAGKSGAEESLWQRMYGDGIDGLLRPTLPNRFCALVPAWQAREIAGNAEKAVRNALLEAGEKVWPHVGEGYKVRDRIEWAAFTPTEIDRKRWVNQLETFLQITWTAGPWKERSDRSSKKCNLHEKLAREIIPEADRDRRCYLDQDPEKELNAGFYWQEHIEDSGRQLAGRRNLRDFFQIPEDKKQAGSKKDRLTGREEEIGETGYGALSILKRMFHKQVLFPQLGCSEQAFWKAAGYEDTRSVAEKNRLSATERQKGKGKSANPYIALLALDGDEMGRWMSGEKAQRFVDNLAGKAPGYFMGLPGFDPKLKRALTPAYHQQFSEALSNVALHMAAPVVEGFGGQLIYAGGDDVLAMLPATEALECAWALRCCFRGETLPDHLQNCVKLNSRGDGFVDAGLGYPLMAPGLEADVSCGIAIGHCNHPLQALVREAQKAEKRAKNRYERAAFALSLVKRSGETLHWGGKWTSNALPLYLAFEQFSEDEKLSGRFPYALAELLKPYRLDAEEKSPKSFRDVVWSEFCHVLYQQSDGRLSPRDLPLADGYLDHCVESNRWADFPNLFLAAAFINRPRGEE